MQRPLRIGYVGSLEPGGTCYSRLVALQSAEPEVHPFDINRSFDLMTMPKWRRWLEQIPGAGPACRRLNHELLEFTREKQLNLLWIDKGSWLATSTLRKLRRDGVILVHHLTDALWPKQWRLRLTRWQLVAGARYYQYYVTSHATDAARLKAMIPAQVLITQLGYDERRFNTHSMADPAVAAKWSNDLIFVGHHEPRTERGICALIDAELDVKVFGGQWPQRARANPKLSGHVFGSLSDQDYVWALKYAKIGLCFVSEWNSNQTAGRSYEIPACGTFLLAWRTREHLQHYKEGEEAEFFGDEIELVRKAQAYIANKERRQLIAESGHRRCKSSGYSWQEIMLRDWTIIRSELAKAGALIK